MKTKLEEISPVKKRLEIEIEAGEVEKRVHEAYRDLGKSLKLPGFRPGKVPRKILERRFGRQVLEEVAQNLIKETLPKAVEETETFPLAMPVIQNELLKVGQSFKYTALMEVRPQFELKDYMGLEVEKEICRVSEEDVNAQLEEIRKAHGQLSPVDTDRVIREEDYAVIEYEGFDGDRAVEGIRGENALIKVGAGEFHPKFDKGLLGLKKGQASQFVVEFEEDFSDSKLAGKRITFRVKVIDIKKMELPELDDEFAKGLGADFPDLKALREKVAEGLRTREEKRIDREMKMRLLKKISDSVHFELPESLVESELRGAIENIRQRLIRSGSDLEEAGLSEEKLREELRPASEKRVKDMMILGEIARKEHLTVSETELSGGFKALAGSTGQDPEALRGYYEAHDMIASFRQQLLEEKALNYLIKGATITQVEADKFTQEKP